MDLTWPPSKAENREERVSWAAGCGKKVALSLLLINLSRSRFHRGEQAAPGGGVVGRERRLVIHQDIKEGGWRAG